MHRAAPGRGATTVGPALLTLQGGWPHDVPDSARHATLSSAGTSTCAWRISNSLAFLGFRQLTTKVWTWRGLVTYYTLFVIDLASGRRADCRLDASASCFADGAPPAG